MTLPIGGPLPIQCVDEVRRCEHDDGSLSLERPVVTPERCVQEQRERDVRYVSGVRADGPCVGRTAGERLSRDERDSARHDGDEAVEILATSR